MKKIVVFALIVLLSLFSLSAAREYVMFGPSAGYNSEAETPELGLFLHYQLGAQLNSKFSLGFGTYLFSDFPLSAINDSTKYSNTLNVAVGPAFSVRLSSTLTLTSVFGVDIMMLTPRSGKRSEDLTGCGFGLSSGICFIPESERASTFRLGFVLGGSMSAIYYENSKDTISLSGRVYFGFTVQQPFLGVYYPDIYERVIDGIYFR